MKNSHFVLVIMICILQLTANAQNPVNWTPRQLMEPAELAGRIGAGKNIPLIYSIGPGAIIPQSVEIGMTSDAKNIAKLKKALSSLPKDKEVVIYCGCCPFEHCPNVRPAIALLQEMQFSNYKLLNLSHNIRTDWIAKGYPVTQ